MPIFRVLGTLLTFLSLITASAADTYWRPGLRPGLQYFGIYNPAPAVPVIPDTANLVATWDADTIVKLADGDPISAWVDTINGATATAAGGPIYKKNVEGTHAAIRFNAAASTQRMEVSLSTALNNAINSRIYTVLITVKNVGSSGFGTPFSASAGGDSFLYVADQSTGGVGRFNGTTIGFAPWASSALLTFGTSSSTTPIGSSNNGLERTYAQGSAVSSALNAATTTGGNAFTIGNIAGGSGLFAFSGDVLAIRVWRTTLTPTQVLQYQKYINWKYGKVDPWLTAGKMTLFDGDSITAGVGASGVAGSYPYKAAQSLGLPYGAWSNLGIGGIKYSDMIAKAPTEIDNVSAVTTVPTYLAAFEWYNEQANGGGPTDWINNARTYLQARGSAGISQIVFGTSTSAAAQPSNRAIYNAYWDTNPTVYNQRYVAIHLNSTIGVDGVYSNNPPFSGDNVHLGDAGYTTLASLFVNQISTLP